MKLTIFCSSIYVSLLAGIWPLSMAQAQVIPDNTLGSENSVVTPNVVINGINSDRLEGGAIRGSNLFHSFQEFSVREGRGAYFSNPEGIANIFSRVTGGNISQIMGTLGVLGNANLYFLNPNGILFGPNAQLDVRGSFLATTADSFQFPNAYGFSASNPTAPPLLTVNIPIGLNFRENATATISNQGTLKTGQDLVLAGNNLNLQGHLEAGNNLTLMATDTVTIRDSLTTPFIAAAWGDLTIQGDKTVDIFALNHPDSGLFSLGNMTLRSAEQVGGDAHFWSGGNFRIERLDGSLGKLYSPHDPVIRTAGDVLIGSYIGASLHIIAGGKVEIPGYVWIYQADPDYGLQEVIALADGSLVNIDGKNQPTLDIRAGVAPEFIGEPLLEGSGFFGDPIYLPYTPSSADINVGTIIFRDFSFLPITGYVSLTNQYQPNPLLSGNIQVVETLPGFGAITTGGALTGGDIILSSRSNVDILGNVSTSSEALAGNILMNAVGDLTIVGNVLAQSNDLAGDITINSGGTVSLLNGSQLNVSSGEGGNIIIKAQNLNLINSSIKAGINQNLGFDSAQAGNISLNINNNLQIDNSYILNTVASQSIGNSGDLDINTQHLYIQNGGSIGTNTFGVGNSGLVTIKAKGNLIIDGENSNNIPSYINNVVGPNAVGNSGGIIINAVNLSMTKGGEISASTYGQGDAGAIQIKVSGDTVIDGESSDGTPSRIVSRIMPNAIGNSQGVFINSSNVNLTNGGEISASTYGQGDAGLVNIQASGDISIDGERSSGLSSRIVSEVGLPETVGNSSGILIETANLMLTNGGQISSSSNGQGDAGLIKIQASGDISIDGERRDGAFSRITNEINPGALGSSNGIAIESSNLILTNLARISSSSSGQGEAGSLVIQANKSVRLNNASILSEINSGAVGNAGDLTIATDYLKLEEGGIISTATFGNGMAGNITITANQSLDIIGNENSSGILSQTLNSNRAGNITINTGTLMMQNRSIIDSETYSSGTAGNININAFNAIAVSGTGEMTTAITSRTQGSGSGGNLTLTTGSLSLEKGAQIAAGTFGEGHSGSLSVVADSIHLKDMATGLFTQTEGQGNSNNLTIQARNLLVENGAVISASTTSSGQGGNLIVNSSESVELRGINSSLQAKTEGSGNAGNVTVTTPQFIVNDGAKASVETTSLGSPGDITITSDQLIIGTNAQLSATITPTSTNTTGGGSITLNASNLDISGQLGIFAETQGQAPAGSLTINPNNNNPDLNIRFTDDGFISARTTSSGKGGNINLSAPNLIDIRGQGKITAETSSSGNAGSIQFNSQQLNLTDGVEVSATTTGTGNAGNILLNTPQGLNIDRNSRLTAETQSAGKAGDITITTQTLNLGQDSELSTRATVTSTNQDGGGSINLNASTLHISGKLGIFAETQGQAPAGTLTLSPDNNNPDLNIRFTNDGFISALTSASGKGGNINLSAPNLIDIRGQGKITTETSGTGNAGTIAINSQHLNLQEGIAISASSSNSGQGGSLVITAPASIRLQKSQLSTQASSSGNAGDINLSTAQLELTENSLISASSQVSQGGDLRLHNLENLTINKGEISASTIDGSAGNLTMNSNQSSVKGIVLENGSLAVKATGTGNSGNLSINARTIELNNSSEISASTVSGTGESVTLTNLDTLTLNNGSQITATTETGRAGSITVNSETTPVNTLNLSQNSQISAQANGEQGEAGSVALNTRHLILERGTVSASNQSGKVGGDVTLENVENLTVNQGEISASTVDGSAGSLTVNSNQAPVNRVTLDNGSLAVKATGTGNSGNLSVNARTVELNNGAEISASTNSGAGESVTLTNVDTLTLNNGSQITATTQTGRAGSITVNSETTSVNTLNLSQNSQISAQANGEQGEAGSVALNTRHLILERGTVSASNQSGKVGGDVILENLETLTVNQGEISASTVEGNAGSLSINTNQNPVKTVQLNQGSLAVKATGTGNSGNLTVNAHTVNLQNHSDISASSNSGKGGNITLPQLETLNINNSQISAATATGTAGSININSRKNVELQNQGRITVEATDGGTAGNLTLQTDTLTIADNSLISVSSLTGQAGNITIQTQDLRLNRGAITAETGKAGEESGANINLTVSRFMTLSMDNNSLISATAYGYADGGNVTINAPLLIAQPGTGSNGNDIVAKAFFGDGGRITINALGIFGISEGKALAGNQSNDIDASSEYGASGVITLNQAIDPNRGLVTLPGNVIDPNSLIEQNVCQRRRQGQSQLTTTGKTDLPPSLGDDFQGIDNGVKLVEPSLREGQANAPLESFSQITPAQGWQRLANGKMLLVSEPLQIVTPQRSPVLPSSCFPNL